MIKRFFSGLWRAITVVRLALANLLFIGMLVILYFVWTDAPAPLPEKAALLLDPVGRVVDQRTRVEAASLLVEADPASHEVLLSDLIDSVELAAEDDRISALVMDLRGLMGIGQSKTSELAEAIERFRQTGKPIVAYGDYYSQDQYRLAVEADSVLLHSYGGIALEGFAVYMSYLAEALEKASVTVNVFRAGEFKSIAEPFLRSDMSDGERAVTQAWLDDVWAAFTTRVEERRGLPDGSIDALLNDYPAQLAGAGGDPAQLAIDAGLVDQVLDREAQQMYLKRIVGAQTEDGRAALIPFDAYVSRMRPSFARRSADTVAIVTAQGNMVPGDQPPGVIGADSMVDQLRVAEERDGTRAIVVRISTGGGSVFASEVIREEMARIRDSGIPLVVSMGNIAASGGYYIATAADLIVATPTTVTGSIGVFAAFPTAERLFERGGIYTDGVGTTPLAGGLRLDRPMAPEIRASAQIAVDDTYEKFLAHVMESRGLDRSNLDEVAQGRVVSAQDAQSAGLVDKLGSLKQATEEAAILAGLSEGDYEVIEILPNFSPRDLLLQRLSDTLGAGVMSRLGLDAVALTAWLEPVTSTVELVEGFKDPRHMYMRCLACEH
ncbi:MAG: signal peptide peptidase SppA [Pseudomonadota bacterium]